MSVEVRPAEFTMVKFDAAEIRTIADGLVGTIGIPATATVIVEVDERTPTGGIELRSLDPIHLFAESGALEHPQRLRHLSADGAREVIGRLLFEANDRLDPSFGAPPLGDPVPLPARVAWDTYIVGRLVRIGGRDQHARRRYHYRSRHGFSDTADAGFAELWSADALTYGEIVAISAGSIGAGSIGAGSTGAGSREIVG